MINSFWNICSTCPMPKEEKLNSEYKRNYVWHPQYKPLAQDVISCAPQSISKEIGMQRRKQYPELAHRSHEVIRHDVGQHSKDSSDLRARSEERDAGQASKSGPRSRSAEPGGRQQQKMIMIQSFPPIASGRVSMLPNTEEFPDIAEQPSETTEYKSQFAWPRKASEDAPCMARKSVSMSIIKGSDETDMLVPKTKMAPVHRPCVKHKEEAKAEKSVKDSKKLKTEYKAKYKPFTSYVYVDGHWRKTSRLVKVPEKTSESTEPWFVEVVERLQKANEYRWRGHGHPVYGELLPDIYKKPPEVPTPRPKVVAPELLSNQPKCHQTVSKRSDVLKKETVLEPIAEKKKERKTSPQLRRPKSAEPAKAKEPVKQKRPATTPPAKPTPRPSSTRRRTFKDDDEKTPKSKFQSTKKPKESTSKSQLSSVSSKKQPSAFPASHSSGGKVWLQAEKSAAEPKPKAKSLVPETSDAVRPSSLSPIPAKPIAEESTSEKLIDLGEEGEKNKEETKTPVIQPSVVPLTHVRTPEEVTGVKSPDPENWTVPIESSERLQWSGVNTTDKDMPIEPSAETIKTAEEISEKLSKLTTEEPVPSPPAVPECSSLEKSSSKLSSASVLDRARSRLDQFWGKNK